jgi:hypothetical protein
MNPFESAWSVLKALQPSMLDFEDAPEEEMRHFQTMQQMNERYTPRGNTLGYGPSGVKPGPFFGGFPSLGGTKIYETQPDLQVLDLNTQAMFSRNPGDARRLREQAAALEAQLNAPPVVSNEPRDFNTPMSDEELQSLFTTIRSAQSRVPYSYRRKTNKPVTDEEVARELRRIRGFN